MKPSKFQFLNPYLVEVNFVTNPDFISGKNDDDVEMQNVFNVQVRKSKNENRANVELTLETNAENDQAPFKLKIKVASDFKWEDLSDERVESMLKMNAPALFEYSCAVKPHVRSDGNRQSGTRKPLSASLLA